LANFQANQSAFVQSRQVRGQVHTGFLRLYDDLKGQVRRAVNRLNPGLPCFVAGHSLGGALATLATADLANNYPNFKDQLRLYTYGAPRVGDRTFAEFVRTTAPNSYRIFNLSDMVSMVPPADALDQKYSHAGQPWAFVDYAEGSVGLSHSTTTYRLAIEGQIEGSPLPRFPSACRGNNIT
jgi:predicted lipase